VGDCFGIVEGTYELSIGDLPSREPITIDEPVAATVIREVRRIRSIERLRESAGESSTAYFPVKGWRPRMAAAELAKDEAVHDVADLVAGSPGMTVRNLVVSLPRSETDLLQSLWILRALEIVGSPTTKEAGGRTAVEPPPTKKVAAQLFAEALAKDEAEPAPADDSSIALPVPESVPSPEAAGFQIVSEPESSSDTTQISKAPGKRPTPAEKPMTTLPAPSTPIELSADLPVEKSGLLDLGDFDPDTELDFGGAFPVEGGAPEDSDFSAAPEPSGVPGPLAEIPPNLRVSDPLDPSAALERALAAAEEEVDFALALGMEKAASSGNFQATPFSEVLRDLCRQRSTGTLICKRNEEEKTVSLDRGRPVFATTNASGERITERLVSEGILEPSDLVRLTEFWPAARRVGGILLALRLVEPDVLRKAIRRQVADIIASIYTWRDGGYYFQERPQASSEEIINDLSLPDLALRGAQKIAENSRLLELIGGDERRLRVSEDPSSLLQGISLTPDQRAFVENLGKGGKVRDLLALGPIPARSATILLFTLVASGILELAGRERITAAGLPDPERYLVSAGESTHAEGHDDARTELSDRWSEISGQGDYALLGIDPGASETEVVAAFDALAPRFHPDRFRTYADSSLLRLAGKIFDRHVLAFYRILNPVAKKPSSEDEDVHRAMLGITTEPAAPASEPRETKIKMRVLSPASAPAMRTGLILDDDPDSARRFSEMLVELGIAPEVAPGRVALRRILSTPGRNFSIAIVDVDLLSGLDAPNLDLLSNAFRTSRIRCIATCAPGSPNREAEVLTRLGVERLLDKSTPADEIREQLRGFFAE